MTQRFLQDNYDPRQELIPRAPDIDGDLPNGSVPNADPGVPDFSSAFADFWSNLLGGDVMVVLGIVGGILSWVWSIYTFLAYLVSLILISLYVYATIKREYYGGLLMQTITDEEKKWNQLYRGQDRPSRLDDVLTHAASEHPNDWKLAIIEADIVLDQVLKERGYVGDTLGERLRSITPSQVSSIDDAWEAHRVRNKIAHEGADFVLTKRIADQTILQYRRVFDELGVE